MFIFVVLQHVLMGSLRNEGGRAVGAVRGPMVSLGRLWVVEAGFVLVRQHELTGKEWGGRNIE